MGTVIIPFLVLPIIVTLALIPGLNFGIRLSMDILISNDRILFLPILAIGAICIIDPLKSESGNASMEISTGLP